MERSQQHLEDQFGIFKKLEKEIKKIKNERKFETARKRKRVNVIDSDSDDDDASGLSTRNVQIHQAEVAVEDSLQWVTYFSITYQLK